MDERKDIRSIKTQNTLFDALLKLLQTNNFEKIKVVDICNEASVNRSTFYAHYRDKYELLLDYVNTLKESLLRELEKNMYDVNTRDYYMEMISLILDHIDEKREIYYPILINNKSSSIIDIISDVIVRDINKRLEVSNVRQGSVPTDILVLFCLGAVSSIIISWLQNKDKYSKEDILNYLNQLLPVIE